MEWLADRLKEIRRKPTELAAHLGIAPPRVYEMLGGRRKLQQSEMSALAEFLEWPVQAVADLVAGKPVAPIKPLAAGLVAQGNETWPRDVPIFTTREVVGLKKGEFGMATNVAEFARRMPKLNGREDIWGIHLQHDDMSPWRERGQIVFFEENRPPREGEHALIEMKQPIQANGDDGPMARITVRKIVKLGDRTIRVRQYKGLPSEYDIKRSDIKEIFRAIEWEELIS
jgi:hypothetical protein